jgi:hypothetical protein
MENIEKIDEVSFKKTIAQPDLVITRTLDDLLAEKESLMQGIQNNKDAITFQLARLDEVNSEIEKVKELGIKTSAEIQVAVEADLQTAKVEPLAEEIKL